MPGKSILDRLAPASFLAAAGFMFSISLFFNPYTETRIVVFIFSIILFSVSGRRLHIFKTLAVFSGIVIGNLLFPIGKIIFQSGFIKITEVALFEGIKKAMVFEGVMFFSMATIRPGLNFPGWFGELISNTMKIYGMLTAKKITKDNTSIITKLDTILLSVYEDAQILSIKKHESSKYPFPGTIILIILSVLVWVPFIFSVVKEFVKN